MFGVRSGIPVVYSTDVPGNVKLSSPEEEFQTGNVKELGVLEDFRVTVLSVLGEEVVRVLHFGPFLTHCTRSVVIDVWLARRNIRSL